MTDPAPSAQPPVQECTRPDCPLNRACTDTKARERYLFRQAEVMLRKELRRYDLRHREETLILLLLELTFGMGMRSVRVPKLDVFVDFTGISRANISRTIESLHGMRMLAVELKDGIAAYSVNSNTSEWMCRIRVTRDQSRRSMEIVKAFNGMEGGDTALARAMEQLKESQPNFPGNPEANFLGGTVADLAIVAGVTLAVQRPLPSLD